MVSEKTKQNWRKYWERTNEVPMVYAVAPKPGVTPCSQPAYLEAFEGGDKFVKAADKVAKWYETHLFLGDTVPFYTVTFGADDFAAYIGAELSLSADGSTSWANHTLKDLANADIRFDPNGKWWTRTQEFCRVLRSKLGDAVIIAAPTLSAGTDGLAGLFGTTELIMAMEDEPEVVKEALAKVNNAYTDVLNAVRETFEYDKYGSITRHGMYIDGTTGVPQTDFSYMISNEMFREFALPSIEYEVAALDYAEYHLDGIGNLKHLEDFCRIEKLHTVQWVPGAGEPGTRDWTWLYKKIISLGKNVFVGGSPDGLLSLIHELDSKCVFCTFGCGSSDEYERFTEKLGRLFC